MAQLLYITGGKNKRYYKIKKNKDELTGEITGEVSRISCAEYDDREKNINLGKVKPKVGDKVIIIIKPYNKYICKKGLVKDVLTSKLIHTRGHKVRLTTGEIGRTLKFV